MGMVLTSFQRDNLRKHVYKSEGGSLVEDLVLRYFWDWLTARFPLWLAPNTITFIGFLVTLATSLCLILQDLGCEGKAPRWAYLLQGIGVFVYQTLDGCDGKQARRTGTLSALGELFDHGCDVFVTFLFALSAACVPGLIQFPYLTLALVALVIQLNYTYHWQTYVSGILYFKKIDIGEALLAHIFTCFLTFFLGPEVWQSKVLAFLGINYSLNFLFAGGTLFFSILNLLSAYHVCLTRGVGKNGSTVADTSVVSPIVTPLVLVGLTGLYLYQSDIDFFLQHPVLFITVFFLPMSKTVVNIMIAGMTKSPFSLFDIVMLGPLVCCINIYFSNFVPEFYLLLMIAMYNIYDITVLTIELVMDFRDTLGVPIFSVPAEKLADLQAMQNKESN